MEVTFDIDANGILNVKAMDKATNKVQHITITGSGGLSKEEIEKMQKEAELHAEEDKKKKEEVEVRNHADVLVAQSERTLKELGEKVKDDVKKPVEEKIAALKEVLAKKDATMEEIKTASNALGEEIQKVGASMYSAAGASAPGADGSTTAENSDEGVKVKDMNTDDNVVEAEVVDTPEQSEDEKKKKK